MKTDLDYVHLAISCNPPFEVHEIVKRMKAKSSKMLREEFPALKSEIPTLWADSYFIVTVGGAPMDVIMQQIKARKE
jgi:putative transposase